MTILEEVLLEEYNRILRTEALIRKELQDLPKGYISRKTIKGKEYFYLQFREDGKIRSRYIKREHLQSFQEKIELRKKDESALKELTHSKATIVKALGKEFINEHTAD